MQYWDQKRKEDITEELERNLQRQFTDTISATKKSGKMQKMINKNYNKEFWIKFCMKINAGWPIKKILYWLRKAQRVTAQIRTDVNDDDDDGCI